MRRAGLRLTLGFALVYLGEHYVIDLCGRRVGRGGAKGEPLGEPVAVLLSGAIQGLERVANG